jgi:LDH2 family malate/lactate/ureidoglycolate dehydrogenase
MKVAAAELRSMCKRILEGAGASPENATLVAEHLVLANLKGVDSHGVFHLPSYVDAIREGLLAPTATPSILKEGGSHGLISGHWTFGQVAALYAINAAIDKAGQSGMSVVGLVQSHHIGRVGHYAERAADHGMACLIFTGGYGVEDPAAAPYGGRARLLHTNPIAFGFPGHREPAVTFDFATTALAGSKVLVASRRNEQLPTNSIIDSEGRPTTDPDAFFAGGAFLPFGGHKGYALMVAGELLGRVLTGSDDYAEESRGGPVMRHQGVAFVVLKADLLSDIDMVGSRVDDLEKQIRAVPPAQGFASVLVPGDPERAAFRDRTSDGLDIDQQTWAALEILDQA